MLTAEYYRDGHFTGLVDFVRTPGSTDVVVLRPWMDF
jgi:hypothetical protein